MRWMLSLVPDSGNKIEGMRAIERWWLSNWLSKNGFAFQAGIAAETKNTFIYWCRGRDSNPHGACAPEDFKSSVSAISPPRLSTISFAYRLTVLAF